MAELALIRKAAAQRYTLGVVYEPDVVDAHGDYARAETIEKACHDFNRRLQAGTTIAKSLLGALVAAEDDDVELSFDVEAVSKGLLSIQHEGVDDDAGEILESYIAPADMTIEGTAIRKGTWLVGVVWSEANWQRIEKGELTGMSIGGFALKVKE